MIKEIRAKLPRWLGGYRLSENDEAQAHIMGMALAALKIGEMNSRLIIQSAESVAAMLVAAQAIAVALGKFPTFDMVLANATLAAEQSKSAMSANAHGTIEREAFTVMAAELFTAAENLKKLCDKRKGVISAD